jgi:hypothetical protein
VAGYDLQTAKQRLGSYSQQRWNQNLSDNDFAQLGQHLGYQGGEIDENMMQRAYGALDSYAGSQGWRPANGGIMQRRDNGGVGTPREGYVPPANTGQTGGATPPDLANILGPGQQLNPAQQAAQEAILRLLTNANRAVTLSDPEIQPVSDAYRSRAQRGVERTRNAIAERAGATGTAGSGGFDASLIGAVQSGNRDVAMFDSNLVRERLDQQRGELMFGIQQATQMGIAEAARDLQRQLAMLDATMRQQDIDLRRTLGQGDLNLRSQGLGLQGYLGRGDLATRLLGMLMQDEQFYSGLGLTAAQFQALLNQNAVLGLLNGGGF